MNLIFTPALSLTKTDTLSANALQNSEFLFLFKQGHHHNGDQAAGRPHMMCSICGRRFATPRFGVRGGRGWAYSTARPWVLLAPY